MLHGGNPEHGAGLELHGKKDAVVIADDPPQAGRLLAVQDRFDDVGGERGQLQNAGHVGVVHIQASAQENARARACMMAVCTVPGPPACRQTGRPGKDLPRDGLSFFKWWRERRLPEIRSPRRRYIKTLYLQSLSSFSVTTAQSGL